MISIMVIAAALVGGFIYALVTHLLLFIVSRILGYEKLKKILDNKTRSFLVLFSLYAILISILSFIHLEKKGYGDFEKMPVGNGYELTSVDGGLPLLEPGVVNGYIDSFAICRKILCAILQKDNNGKNMASCIVFKTADKTLLEFTDSSAYKEYASSNDLPLPATFNSFGTNYDKYWSAHETWWFPF